LFYWKVNFKCGKNKWFIKQKSLQAEILGLLLTHWGIKCGHTKKHCLNQRWTLTLQRPVRILLRDTAHESILVAHYRQFESFSTNRPALKNNFKDSGYPNYCQNESFATNEGCLSEPTKHAILRDAEFNLFLFVVCLNTD